MNSPPTPPSFTFYIFQIEIYGGNLSEEIEYKGNYFLNLSLISEHFACFVFQNQLMAFNESIHEHSCFKKVVLSSFAFCLLSFVFSSPVAQNGRLSLFNTRPTFPANTLKTKELRKRHFWLKFLSQGKPLRFKTLGTKFAHYFSHFPADPTLHTPPETDPTYSAAKPCTM